MLGYIIGDMSVPVVTTELHFSVAALQGLFSSFFMPALCPEGGNSFLEHILKGYQQYPHYVHGLPARTSSSTDDIMSDPDPSLTQLGGQLLLPLSPGKSQLTLPRKSTQLRSRCVEAVHCLSLN